jgi:hypothetical protein
LWQVCTDDAAVTALDVRAFDWRHTVNQRLKDGSLTLADLKEESGLVAWHGLTVHSVNWGVVDENVIAIQPGVKVPMQPYHLISLVMRDFAFPDA